MKNFERSEIMPEPRTLSEFYDFIDQGLSSEERRDFYHNLSETMYLAKSLKATDGRNEKTGPRGGNQHLALATHLVSLYQSLRMSFLRYNHDVESLATRLYEMLHLHPTVANMKADASMEYSYPSSEVCDAIIRQAHERKDRAVVEIINEVHERREQEKEDRIADERAKSKKRTGDIGW